MVKKYILAIDQGTTSTRAILFDRAGAIVASEQREFPQYFPEDGAVEHDANEIWQSVQLVLADLFIHSEAEPAEVAAIGITNQRETTVVWDRKTGLPIYHALVWQSRQSAGISESLVARGLTDFIHERTGLVIDAYFSATKIRWILDHVEGAQARAEAGELLFGTIDSWLLWKLTEGESHLTDVTNASRTMLYNIKTNRWDEEILALLQIPAAMLPEVRANSEILGVTRAFHFFGEKVPIANLMGDQQAALVGQGAFERGMVKATYGTGAFIMMNTGEAPHFSTHRLLSTVAYQLTAGQAPVYALEGSIFIAGSVVQWLRDGLGLIERSADSEALALRAVSSDGLYLVPAFTGLGAPYWDSEVRGAVFGLTRATTKADLTRAALSAIAYQVKDVLDTMTADAGLAVPALRVDGGATANGYLMQFQADLLQLAIERPANVEATAWGTALLAGLAVGFWESLATAPSADKGIVRFQPQLTEEEIARLYAGWQRAVAAARSFTGDVV